MLSFFLHSRSKTLFFIYLFISCITRAGIPIHLYTHNIQARCTILYALCNHRIQQLDFYNSVSSLPWCTCHLSASQLCPMQILELRATIQHRCHLSQYVLYIFCDDRCEDPGWYIKAPHGSAVFFSLKSLVFGSRAVLPVDHHTFIMLLSSISFWYDLARVLALAQISSTWRFVCRLCQEPFNFSPLQQLLCVLHS